MDDLKKVLDEMEVQLAQDVRASPLYFLTKASVPACRSGHATERITYAWGRQRSISVHGSPTRPWHPMQSNLPKTREIWKVNASMHSVVSTKKHHINRLLTQCCCLHDSARIVRDCVPPLCILHGHAKVSAQI